ncbi:Uncharacterized protein dnm_050600 [Desulfonema magnum]|uniref:Uncharacterized protein n=1 Tax=Desulfonema magnum TaxID=45655 RepID=A0A975BPK4_9BACT|nr:Uncharacterized protein dnm_050600 [Desulfonema magnum]
MTEKAGFLRCSRKKKLIITDLGEGRPSPVRAASSQICYKYVAPTGLGGGPANLLLQICRPYRAWSALP